MKKIGFLLMVVLFFAVTVVVPGPEYADAESAPVLTEPLEDFLARHAGRMTPSEQKAAAARLAAAREAARRNGYTGPMGVVTVPGGIPDFFDTPNWANSPALTKFLDPVPGLYISGVSPAPAPGTQYIPVAVADILTYPGSDYYELELGQYSQQLHSELGPTTLRGYRQTNTTDPYVSGFHYLGPVIIAQKDRPVRIKFTNALPAGVGGNLYVPVDTSIMGAGDFLINFDPETKLSIPLVGGNFTENRATLHLHGGHSPWISDGTPHQWITPAGEITPYSKGVSVSYVPDMWFDNLGSTVASCAGLTTCAVPGASNNPGPGAQTFYWSNQQSARLMFYHDHAWGITRLNVYVGEAAGFLLTDPKEQQLINTDTLQGPIGPLADVGYGTPLVIQFRTFVDENPLSPTYVRATDPTWAWGTGPVDAGGYPTPASGDLWLPHVYMPAQNPYNPDFSGINPFGRWHYGPWFFPPTPVCGSTPLAVKPMCVEFGTAPNEYYDPACNPAVTGFCQPPLRPGTPKVSWGAEAFHDTAMVNGAVFPVLAVDPKPYRFRILNADNDKFLNLQLYKASPIVSDITLTNPGSGYTTPPTVTITGDGVGATAVVTISPMGYISNITVDTAGSGYNPAATAVTITGDGNGAIAYALVNTGTGAIDGIVVTNGGSGYTAATVDIAGDGIGAAATATVVAGLGDVTGITLTTVGSGYTFANVAIAPPPPGGVQATANAVVYTALTEVGMVPAASVTGYPASWPVDGREGGVPDPSRRGPAFLQIGTEGGFLPGPVVLPNQPVTWNLDPTMFNVGNVLNQRDGGGTLMLGGAERADVIIDFTKYAGQTLILYNDGPSAWPALDPHYDYYTGAPDRRDMGGYGPIPPGKGPNVRTIMQIKVAGTGGTAPADDYNTVMYSALQNASKSTGSAANNNFVPGIFADSQDPVIVGQAAYNSTYNKAFPQIAPYWGISGIGDSVMSFHQPDGLGGTTVVTDFPMHTKAIHDEMGGTFDDYGRMSAKLGLEAPFTNAAIANFILQNYVDPPTEVVRTEGYQIWKITHNGVDTHPIHFHLFEVQLVNRVGWDGFIRLPDQNELGWKDTLRISPLEDTIVALRPKAVVVPFPLPDSVRPLNPMRPIDLDNPDGFSQVDILTGGAMATPQTNRMFNFGWEYVWHCHLLSHEENDMMRSLVFQVEPPAPSNLNAVANALGGVTISWTDNSASESGFNLQRDTDPLFPAPVDLLVNQSASLPNTAFGGIITFDDPTAPVGQIYYRVQAMDDYLPTAASLTGSFQVLPAYSAWVGPVPYVSSPIVHVSPAALNFGNQLVGTTGGPRTLTLSNTGTAALDIIGISLAGADIADFSLPVSANPCGASLPPGATCTIDVTFTPTAVGARAAAVSITSNDPANGTLSVPLTGSGIATTTVAMTAPAVTYGQNGSVTVTVTSLQVTPVTGTVTLSIDGGAAVSQTLVNGSATFDGTNAPALVLPAAGSHTLLGSFAAQGGFAAGSATGALVVGTAALSISPTPDPALMVYGGAVPALIPAYVGFVAGQGPANLTGTVTCTTTATSASPAGAYPSTCSGATSTNYAITYLPGVVNVNQATSLTAITSNLPNPSIMGQIVTIAFSVAPQFTGIPSGTVTVNASSGESCSAPLAGGTGSCTITFATGGARTLSATYAGDANFLGSTSAQVTQTVSSVTLSTSSLLFGNQLVGTGSASQAVTLSNVGTAPLAITGIAFAGSNPADFTLTQNCPVGGNLNAGQSCQIFVRFRPTVAGVRTAVLSISDSDTTSPQTVALTGTGVAPISSVSPLSLSFSSPLNIRTAAQGVTVSNTGTAPLIINLIGFGGAAPSQFGQTNTCPIGGAGLPAGGSCTVNVTFRPTSNGTKSASLLVNVAAPGVSQSVALTGTVIAPTYSVTPGALSYGNQGVGVPSAAQVLTVTNTGATASLRINEIFIGGANPSDFEYTHTCGNFPRILAPGASCTISVTFIPQNAGAKTAAINVSVAAPAISVSVPLSGTGQ